MPGGMVGLSMITPPLTPLGVLTSVHFWKYSQCSSLENQEPGQGVVNQDQIAFAPSRSALTELSICAQNMTLHVNVFL